MQEIVKLVSNGPSSNRLDEDFADRLNSRYTVLFLMVFTIVVSSCLYLGKPITCWPPKEFRRSWIKYMNNYCWVKNTYYVAFNEAIPKVSTGERESREIHYYQWLPFIMIAQALGFYMPSVIWHTFNQKAGVDCDDILAAAKKYHSTPDDKGRERLMCMITKQMDRFLRSRPSANSDSDTKVWNLCCCVCSFAHGKYLTMLYMFTKILYFGNIVAQFFFLSHVLDLNFPISGYKILHNIMHKDDNTHATIFPRVTMCDFSARKLANVHRYSVPCVLPINMYTEKIYVFLWVWMLLVGVVSVVSFLQWLFRCVCSQDKYRYVHKQLRYAGTLLETSANSQHQTDAVNHFVDTYLQQDGVFVLHLIGHNTNNMTVSDIVMVLWDSWMIRERERLEDR